MKKCFLLIALPVLLFSCKGKKLSLAINDEKVDIRDLLELVQPLKLPYEVTDTILRRKEPDASLINYALFTRLVPDSVLTRLFGKDQHPRLYAIGRIKVPDAESYVFVKGAAKDRRALYIVCFDKRDHFSAAKPVLYADKETGVSGQADMDNKYTLTLLHQRKTAGGETVYHKDAYVFAEGSGFQLILTESNEMKAKPAAVYDPIDTLARKHKYSGDYAQDKRNIVAVRDGRDGARFLFFIHFEKDDATCQGELKGEARFVSPGLARYKSYSDPCALEFSFDVEGVSVKETGGCGVHRDIKCFFEGYYNRKATKAKPEGKEHPKVRTDPA